MDKEWILNYWLDDGSIRFMQLKASPVFNEIGEYTSEECVRIMEFLRSQPIPEIKEEFPWGGKTYREWDEFVGENKIKIKQLLQ